METPSAAPMGLACQSLLVRDDGGGIRHPFQYGGVGPTSASESKHWISGVVSKADHAMLRENSIDFGYGLTAAISGSIRHSRSLKTRAPQECSTSSTFSTRTRFWERRRSARRSKTTTIDRKS